MNIILKPVATATLGSCNYESPVVTMEDLVVEGVLCQSGNHEEWGTDDDLWS